VAGFAVTGAAEPDANTLTLATYNVANYTLTDRQIEGAWLPNYPKPEREKTALRRVIHEIDADVLALQEVGGEDFLRELQRDLRREGLAYDEAVVLTAVDEQRKVAVLSRLPLVSVGRHDDLHFKYFDDRERVKRGMLEVVVETPMGEVTLFIVHLKSRRTEREDDPQAKLRRGREATAARDRILEKFPPPDRAPFVILGDFNEGPLGRPLRAFTRIGDWRISRAVPAVDSRDETWTHFYRRNDEYTRVDYILVSAPLWPRVREGRATIPDSPDVLQASDHRPVVLRLDVSPATD
jgi:endonuclease/exonuclease/phosphatase family metal-dependent hydrolase